MTPLGLGARFPGQPVQLLGVTVPEAPRPRRADADAEPGSRSEKPCHVLGDSASENKQEPGREEELEKAEI